MSCVGVGSYLWTPLHKSAIFFTEVAGIYVFATYWVIKTIEASRTGLDKRAGEGKLATRPHGLSDLLRPLPVIDLEDPKAQP